MRGLAAIVVALGAACHAPAPRDVARGPDCGLAALALVGGMWGETWTVDDLAREFPHERHCRIGTLRDVARARGLDAYVVIGSARDLEHELGAGRPIVLGLRDHYEVAVALDPDDESVITIEPASGARTRRTRAALEVAWKAARHVALVVSGTLDVRVARSR